MAYEPITIPFRVTVRGGQTRRGLLAAARALAVRCKGQGVPLKLRVGDDVFEALARNAGQCYCHAELGEQKDALHALQREFPRPDLDTPPRLWGVIQDRFDLVRAMCDTDGLVLFPPAEGQFPEFLYMLSELARRKEPVSVVLLGWTKGEFGILKSLLLTDSALVLSRFPGHEAGTDAALGFLRQSRAFLARTATVEAAA